jgi:hypothetical protein
MRDCTEVFNESGEHIATIGFNKCCGFWQIVVVQREEIESFVRPRKSRSPRGTTNLTQKRDFRARPRPGNLTLDHELSAHQGRSNL